MNRQAIWMVIVMKCSTVEYVLLKRQASSRHRGRYYSDANGRSIRAHARKILKGLGICPTRRNIYM